MSQQARDSWVHPVQSEGDSILPLDLSIPDVLVTRSAGLRQHEGHRGQRGSCAPVQGGQAVSEARPRPPEQPSRPFTFRPEKRVAFLRTERGSMCPSRCTITWLQSHASDLRPTGLKLIEG